MNGGNTGERRNRSRVRLRNGDGPSASRCATASSRTWLDARSRTIRLADLLIEVENDPGFSVHSQQPGEKRVDPGEVCALLAAILAHGCNLGLYTMEKVAPDIAYRRLKYVSDWRAARAAIRPRHLPPRRRRPLGRRHEVGQRFAMPQKLLQRTYSTRFNDFALEFWIPFAPTRPAAAEFERPTPTARRLVAASISPNTRRAYSGALRRLDDTRRDK